MAEEDLQRVAAATGGTVQTSVNNVIDEVGSHSVRNCLATCILGVPLFFRTKQSSEEYDIVLLCWLKGSWNM